MLHPRKDYQHIQDPAGKIPEDEPVFLLRAQDRVAAETVRFWAKANLDAGGDPHLTEMAFEHAKKMFAWPTKKLADLPADYDQLAAEPEPPAAEPEQQGDQERLAEAKGEPSNSVHHRISLEDEKAKTDAAGRRTAGNSPW